MGIKIVRNGALVDSSQFGLTNEVINKMKMINKTQVIRNNTKRK